MKKYHLVYQITNTLNNHIYIGVHTTNELEDGYMGSGTFIRKAIKESGKENFKKEILFFCNTKEEMLEKEKELVNLDFIKRKDTYNRIIGGSQFYPLGMTHTEETKKKMSELRKRRIISEEERKRLSELRKRRIISEEERKRLSELRKGKIVSEETKRKMSEVRKGRIVSEETKRKMSESNKGKTHSEETRKRIGEFHKNKIVSEETRRKLSESGKRRTHSEETRKRISESKKIFFSQKQILESKQLLYFI